MATYVDPATVVASVTDISADLWNQDVRDNVMAISEWTSFSPTVTQSGAVTKTNTYSKYKSYGGTVEVIAYLTMTGAGTGNNVITVSLPVTGITATGLVIGCGEVVDTGSQRISTNVYVNTTTTVKFLSTAGALTDFVGKDPNFALASGDTIAFTCRYEAA